MNKNKLGKISDIADIITGFSFKGEDYSQIGSLKVVRGENVTIGNLRWDTTKYWDHSTEELKKYFLSEDDLVIGMDGSRVGYNRAAIRKTELPLILAQRVARLRAKKGNSQKFLNYLILSDKFPEYVEAIHTGTSIPHISQSQIADFEVQYPLSFDEQESIAEVLCCLDDKIDLLHRNNKTLEQLAETLFRQWFEEEADDSWEEKTLYDVIDLIGGGTPMTSKPEYWDGSISWLSGGDISSNHKSFVTNSEKKITELGLKNSSARLLPKYSTVISARGTVGKYCLIANEMTFSQSNYGIRPKIKDCFFFTYLLINHSVEELQSASYGTVFDTITTNTFKSLNIKLPKDCYIIDFNAKVEPLFNKILHNVLQIQQLELLRNTLLPKLMSGTVKINTDEDK